MNSSSLTKSRGHDCARALSALPSLVLALSLALAVGCASSPPLPPPLAADRPFAKEIQAFADRDRTNPPPKGAILFIGSSSIRLWKTLAEDFPNHKVINRGFGGSQIIDSVNYADRIALPYRPKHIIMYAGGNDINDGKTPEQVFADFKAFAARIRAKLPTTRISYISIAPNPKRWAQVERIRAANAMIEEYTRRDPLLSFINVFPAMLGPDGNPKPDIYVEDRLHMNANGYAIWREIVGPWLAR
jgi:lysophospholipase L1-like esterase